MKRQIFPILIFILIFVWILTFTVNLSILNISDLNPSEDLRVPRSVHIGQTTRAYNDTDSDGISDEKDQFPNDPAASTDSDSDGCPDEWNQDKTRNDSTSNPRLNLDHFPTNPGACLDTDGDGLPDQIILARNTQPDVIEDIDDDNDGLPDLWEDKWKQHALDYDLEFSFNTTNSSDAMKDFDGDGFSNLNEYIKNTNPYDEFSYPKFTGNSPNELNNWTDFLIFLVFFISVTMIIAIIIGIYIAKYKKSDEEFWLQTFGEDQATGSGDYERLRRGYINWQRQIEAETRMKTMPKRKYKLEIIGGFGNTHDLRYKHDPRFKGKFCIWCDRGITTKYIKCCPEMRTYKKGCSDGPFCSKKCLNEHLKTVPHYKKVNF